MLSAVAPTIRGEAHLEYIEFDRNKFHRAALRLTQMIWSISPGKMTMNRQGGPQIGIDIIEAAVAAQPNEPMLRVQLAQIRNQMGQTDSALRQLREILTIYPNFSAARLELARGFSKVGKTDEAEKEIRALLSLDPADGQVHHELAHILAKQNDTAGAQKAFQEAESCQPGAWGHHKCHAELLLRIAGPDRRRLLEAHDLIDIAIQIGGAQAETYFRPHLIEIHRRLAKTRPNRPSKKKRASRR